MANQIDPKFRVLAEKVDAMNRELTSDLNRLFYPNGRQEAVDRLDRLIDDLGHKEFERAQGRSLWNRT